MRRRKKNTKIYLILLLVFLSIGVVYGALTTSLSMSGTIKVDSAKYNITYSGSNVTFSPTSGSIIYGSTTTNKITPSTGYYLKSFSCTNGYTNNATTGVGALNAQTITINNNNNVGASTCTATMSNTYTVTATGTGVTLGAASLGITYGKTVTLNVTPSTGYYLKNASCTNGYTATATTGTSATGVQTVTINNNSKTANSTCTFTGDNTYNVTLKGDNLNFDSSTLSIAYGSSASVKVTVSDGYMFRSYSCDNGYTLSNLTTGSSAASEQTITIKNNNKTQNSTCTITTTPRTYYITMAGSNVTFESKSLPVIFGSTKTVTITPSTGYYLSSIACTNGYTVTNVTTGASATGAQTVTINNNSKATDTTCTANIAKSSYAVTITGSNATYSSSNVSVQYGGTNTFTLTPSTGYYLSSISCTNGYTATATTGTSATGAQTVTIKNNSKVGASTCTVTMAARTFTATIAGGNTTFSSTTLSVPYGGTAEVTATPNTGGYYLGTATCTNGYTITGGTYGKGNTTAQTLTINNNGNLKDTTCTITSVHAYHVTLSGTNATFGTDVAALAYGGTTTVTITPSTGYYLKSFTCTNGYTNNATTGVGATAAQTVTITNPSTTKDSICTATMSNSYTVAMSGSYVTFSSTSLEVTYGGTKTVTLTPSSGYYLKSISCTNGYTATATTGTSATSAQTVTIKNNSNAKNSTCTASMESTYSGPTEWEFSYLGSIEEFEAPLTGTYKLEVYGAQGGTNTKNKGTGGLGGYSSGTITLTAGTKLYVVVGGTTTSTTGGYNGGGKGTSEYMGAGRGGGGATHIATSTGLLADLSTNQSSVLIVAGGGGGGVFANQDNSEKYKAGGAGGGETGIDGGAAGNGTGSGGAGGTQTEGAYFGKGGNGSATKKTFTDSAGVSQTKYAHSGGGGGGWYGGSGGKATGSTSSGARVASGGGGSGYIGGVTGGTTTAGQREGNGYAKITLVS